MGRSYYLGKNERESVKLDIYYTDPYIREFLIVEGIRLAHVEDIVAMKVEVLQNVGRKKDFWDLHELLDDFSVDAMIALHAERYPYSHDHELIKTKFTDFTVADEDFEPVCLRGKPWELIKLDLMEAVKGTR
jgi:predicted nucleotidyltransferase component of viral defense system